MKKLLIALTLLTSMSTFAGENDGFYFAYEKNRPLKNGIVYYEEDERMMKLYGHQGIGGFKDLVLEVNKQDQLVVKNTVNRRSNVIAVIDTESCGDVDNYEEEKVTLCSVDFIGKNKIKVKDKKVLRGWTDANGAPQIPQWHKDFYFTLVLDGKKVSKAYCMDHFLSCRL